MLKTQKAFVRQTTTNINNYKPSENQAEMNPKPNFIVDPESFRLLRNDVGIGRIVELDPKDAALVAPHIQHHSETIYCACSGVSLSNQFGGFQIGERQLAIEWVRKESKPQPNEPECNTYRYLFGLTSDGKCVGFEVTRPLSSSSSGQVADHWTTFEDVVTRHFPNE